MKKFVDLATVNAVIFSLGFAIRFVAIDADHRSKNGFFPVILSGIP